MMGLVRLARVELSRLLHRRAIVVLLAACVVIPLLIGVAQAIDTRPASDEDIAFAQRQLDADLANGNYERELSRCIKNPGNWGLASNLAEGDLAAACKEMVEPQLDWYLWQPQLDLAEQRDEGTGVAAAMVLAMLLMIVGTTFAGHDWASGSLSNQVLFEPRRARVWLVKAAVVVATAFTTACVVLTGFWLALNALASSRDVPHGGELLRSCLAMGLRASLIAAIAALLGFAFTMLFRSTVATLGIVFGVALVGGTLLAVFGFDANWNPALNVLAVIGDGFSYEAEIACPPGNGDGWCYEQRTISLAQGLSYVGAVAVAVSALSLAVFRRRDIA